MRVRRVIISGFALLALALPAFAQAAASVKWDFVGDVPGTWQVKGWDTALQTPEGLHIKTTHDGNMLRKSDVKFGVDAVRFIFIAEKPTDALFLWHVRGRPEEEVIQLPFQIPAGKPSVVDADLDIFPQWDRYADQMGIALPAGTDVMLLRIELGGWSFPERVAAAWQSFWTFDTFNGTSINFLWGPILRTNLVGVQTLFQSQPPAGWAVNRVFYTFLAIAALALLFWAFAVRGGDSRSRHAALKYFFAFVALLWLLFDIRMGAEFIRYAMTDKATYLDQPLGKRNFRSYSTFFDSVFESLPILQAQPTFGFIGAYGPLETRARYFAYPSIPLSPELAKGNVRTWFVSLRSDVSVDAQGRLLLGGDVLAEGGKIVKRFDASSFLYQTP